MAHRGCVALYNKATHLPPKLCNRVASKGSVYCKKHQGVSHLTPEHKAAMREGYARYIDRMRALLAAGLGVGHAGGNKGQKRPRAGKKAGLDKINFAAATKQAKAIGTAERNLRKAVDEIPPVPEDKDFKDLTPDEQLRVLTGMSFVRMHQVLALPLDPVGQPMLFKEQMKVASAALSIRVKVDRNALVARRQDNMKSLLERLKEPGDDAKLIEPVKVLTAG